LFLLKNGGGDNISKKNVGLDGLIRIYLRHSCLSLKQRADVVSKPNEKKNSMANSLYMNRALLLRVNSINLHVSGNQ